MALTRFLRYLVSVAALCSSLSLPASPQSDPLLRQKRALERIDSFVDHYRKTGDFKSRVTELQQAEKELISSNRELMAREDWAAAAQGLIKLGAIQRMQGEWEPAIALYRQAEETATKARHPEHQANALIGRAMAESAQREHGAAIADAERAVQLARPLADRSVLFDALDTLAQAQVGLGNLVAAADSLNQAFALAPALKEPWRMFYGYLDRADVYLKTAEKCDYQRVFEPCYLALDRAKSDYTEALALARKLGFSGLARTTEGFLAEVELRRSLINSRQGFDQNLQATRLFHPKEPSEVLVTESFVASGKILPPGLLEQYRKEKAAKALGGFANVVKATSLFVEGSLSEANGDNDAALASYMKALDVLESDRRGIKDEANRGTLLEDKIGFYYAPILQLLQARRFEEAFALLERSKSRSLADLIANKKLGLARPEEQRLYAQSVTLRARIGALQDELFELSAGADRSKNAQRMEELVGQIRKLEATHQEVLARTAVEAPRVLELVVSEPVSLKKLQAAMREEHFEMLQYLVLEHAVILWHIAPDAVHVRNVFLPRSEVIGKVAALQKSLEDRNGAFDESTAKEMYLFLIQPALAWIKSERLIIVPHEVLHQVPFQVFKDPASDRFLGERFQISYAPSATVLLAMKRARSVAAGRLLAVADPDIAAAPGEVRAIAKLFPGRSKVVTDELATETNVKSWIGEHDLVHLSVHGKFNAGEPLLSYLQLRKSGDDDGRLTAAEMFGLPLEKAQLLVLSACETGKAEATHANEILGMVRALLYAGAGTLVLSYWEVDSAATALWMRTFYQASLTKPPGEAARAALLRVKKERAFNHPYYWGAFMLVGR
jgi:CHAT domain-containing protein